MKHLICVLSLALCASAQINVREKPFRARGDGKTDDTAAFQKALDAAAAAGGGTVFAPAGRYLIATHLRVPGNTTLAGVGRAPQTYDPKEPRTTLLAVEGAGNAEGTPFLSLAGPNSTLEGITVFYPEQKIAETPVAYPWTVRGGTGDNISLINVLLVNPWQGVDFGGTIITARHYVRGLYGQPLSKGLLVDQCYDIGRIKEVHFWPFWTQDKKIIDYTTTHGTGFIFRRTDWEVVEDILVWGYQTGVQLTASKFGAMNGQMTNINLDNVDIGVDIDETQPYVIHFSGLNIANAGAATRHIAFWGHGPKPAEVTIRGASFWGQLNQAV
ncbi:MAG: glycosyl hydrolase family 28-related protein, partial [Acidobacteria bacterium]|nr:glycosyl hydrolase family 28-related protein [Acidobacteriota bacterium]